MNPYEGQVLLVCVAYTVIIFGIGFARGYAQGLAARPKP